MYLKKEKKPNKNNRWRFKVKCDTHSNVSGLQAFQALDEHEQELSQAHFVQ